MPIRPVFELRQQNDTLLLVGISTCDDCHATFCVAPIVGQVRHVDRDVKKVAGAGDEVVLKSIAVPTAGFAAQDINGRFVAFVLMRF